MLRSSAGNIYLLGEIRKTILISKYSFYLYIVLPFHVSLNYICKFDECLLFMSE